MHKWLTDVRRFAVGINYISSNETVIVFVKGSCLKNPDFVLVELSHG